MQFWKYQALGNDYLVMDGRGAAPLAPALVRRICDRHFGVGSDGILWHEPEADGAVGLRIYNPDGSEAEKSGNGLRIFARYLFDRGLAGDAPFAVSTPGGRVSCHVLDGGLRVEVEMGRVSFSSRDIPVAGPEREVLEETLEVGGESVLYSAATVGNPHCVVLREKVSAEEAHRLGPLLENLTSRFPNRTNVQFVQVLGERAIQIEIWERGAGYTLASGSSSCAAAAVAHRLGRVGPEITVHMPGGELHVALDARMHARQVGPVRAVATGAVADELIEGR
ncbi:MAG: diaminopimelate epimerase [Proteobacteria bacterium]|nr:MAG: diaminopimelate epimerase [Pseudomonadota bacterium]